jgi:hypothetical protein
MDYRLRENVYESVCLASIGQDKVEHLQYTDDPYLLGFKPKELLDDLVLAESAL